MLNNGMCMFTHSTHYNAVGWVYYMYMHNAVMIIR